MKTRNYDKKDGFRVWLSHQDTDHLLSLVEDEPRRRLAFELGLAGLRTDEVTHVTLADFKPLTDDTDAYLIEIHESKTEPREVPVPPALEQRARMLKSATRQRKDDPLVDVGNRQVRNWVRDVRDPLQEATGDEAAQHLGMHDLRRTWATDTFYTLSFNGVPNAEPLTMAWGGWAMTESGRATFRQNYLGPVPNHVAAQAVDVLW